MTTLTVGSYTIGGLDGVASVVSAAQAYTANPTNANLVAYDAALANAAAAATSLIQGEGAAYAGNALSANIVNLITNGSTMSASDKASGVTSIAGDLVTMVGQGVTVLGLDETTLNPLVGGGTFTVGQLVTAVGFITTALGAGFDSSSIAGLITQQLQSAGFEPDANGVYTPSAASSSNFVCDANNVSTMWDIVQENNTDEISGAPAATSDPNGVATVVVDAQGGDLIVSPGTPGTNLDIDVVGNNNGISGENSSTTIGGQYNLAGTGTSAAISNATVTVQSGASTTVTGSGDQVKVGADSTTTVAGGGNTFTLNGSSSGSTFTLEGTGANADTVNLAGATDLSVLLGDAATEASFVSTNATVTSVNGGGIVSGSTGDNLTVLGVNVTLNANGGHYDLTGSDDTANLSNSTLSVASGDQATVVGSNNSVNLGSDTQADISGTGDTVSAASGDVIDLSNATITLAADSSVTIEGSNDTIVGAAGDIISVAGQADYVDASDATVALGDETLAVITGNGDTVTAASGTDAGVNGNDNTISSSVADDGFSVSGTENTLILAGDGVTFQQGSTGTVDGDNNAIAAAGGDVDVTLVGLYDNLTSTFAGDGFAVTGAGDTFSLTGDGVTFAGNSGGTITGDDNSVATTAAGDGVSLVGNGDIINAASANDGFTLAGSNETVNVSDDEVIFEQGSNGAVNGNDNAFDAAGGDIQVTFDGSGDGISSSTADNGFAAIGNSETFNITGDGVTFYQDSGGTVEGNGNSIATAGTGDGVALFGNGDTIDSTIAGDGFDVTGTDETFNVTDAQVFSEAGSQLDLYGSDNAIAEAAGDSIAVYGNDDGTSGGDGSSVAAYGTGDTLNGSSVVDGTTGYLNSSDAFSDPTDDSGEGSGTGDPGDDPGTGDPGDDPETGDLGDGGNGGDGFAGPQSVVTAALASNISPIAQYDISIGNEAGAASADAAFLQAKVAASQTPTAGTGTAVDSGSQWAAGETITWNLAPDMGTQYDAEVQQAFATWAAASGITFEEVSGTSTADIQIEFSDLDTSSTALAGYTTYQASSGQISSAVIQLEDPTQDALITGADGQQTYTGTDATLSQLLLHEIGHALGLADDSDQDSVMYYELTSSNRTLDSTDITGIQSLYRSAGGSTQSAVTSAATASESHTAVAHQLTQLVTAMASFNPQSAGNTSLGNEDVHQHLALAASAS